MYEQKNTNGEWDLVTIIEGHASWYRQNRLLHRILIYQYFSFIENLVRLEVNTGEGKTAKTWWRQRVVMELSYI